jgi:hypothetical protein
VNPQTLNLYSYVRNNPLKYVDPTGHQDEDPRKKGKKGNDDDPPPGPLDVVVVNINDAEQRKRQQQQQQPTQQPGFDWDNFNRRVWGFNNSMSRLAFGFEKFSFTPVSSTIRAVFGEQAHHDYQDAAMALLPLAIEARTEAAVEGEMDDLLEVTIDSAKHPEAADHILDAQGAGYPNILTLDREGAVERRTESLQGIPKVSGKQLDEG